ncbi:hypothetical protein CGL51_04600 [Pyrobaculum aerophilum]|uniref:PIN domain-containing protein n=2 Tax=Pyrobaculum aerophilum TaxID=13773 RepID=A0A371R0N0_9CREN|nr:hypothetical protein CGL52_11675 [Pyrobaculum aerophilum]RFA96793.1 hypothetical protein CGL51_04600 [Pyrobaculum aerophilum]
MRSLGSKRSLHLRLFRHGLELSELLDGVARGLRAPSEIKILADTSIILASMLLEERDRVIMLSISDLLEGLSRLQIPVLVSSTTIFDAWSALAKRAIRQDLLPAKIISMIESFISSPSNIIVLIHKATPLVEGRLNIKWEPLTHEDVYAASEATSTNMLKELGIHDIFIVSTAKRLGAYLLTADRKLRFLKYAVLDKGVMVVIPCSWVIASYYRKHVGPRYVQSQRAVDIFQYVVEKESRIKSLVNRFEQCMR